ncbi:hypothetical protein RB195_017333 [Necator americanus]|uniref:BPTI/Kunitz inhibitor domain-containing protein n=1 Tax=Necator americanus TaxID=51031 RepID=A0ABR1C698_NECAM
MVMGFFENKALELLSAHKHDAIGHCHCALRSYRYLVSFYLVKYQIRNLASAIPSRCYEGIVTGPCRAMHERYAYDPAKGECVRFNYGGCAGNNNNFMSKLECQLVCRPTACGLPIETGMCFASLRRYAFDDTRGRCVSFIYGGCGGNENNFETLEDCEYACLNTITSR